MAKSHEPRSSSVARSRSGTAAASIASTVAVSMGEPRGTSSPPTRTSIGRPATTCRSLAPASRAVESSASSDASAAGFGGGASLAGAGLTLGAFAGAGLMLAGLLTADLRNGSLARSSAASSVMAGIARCDLRDGGRVDFLPTAGMARTDARRTTLKRACTRPSFMIACTPTEPRPSMRVVHTAGRVSMSSR